MLKRKQIDADGASQRPAKAVRFTDPLSAPAVTGAPGLQADPKPVSLKRRRPEGGETTKRPSKSRRVDGAVQSSSTLLTPAANVVASEAGQPAETPSDTPLSGDGINTAMDACPVSTKPPPKKQRKSAKQRQAAKQRLQTERLAQAPKPCSDQSAFRNVPNEIMDRILERMDVVDMACFALTSKQNYQLVKEATHKIPKELCPHIAVYFPCQMTIKGKGDYRPLLRRLVLWLPREDMLYCLRAPRVAPRSEILKRDRLWKKKFFKDWSYARMGIIQSLRRMNEAELKKAKVKGVRSSQRLKTIRGRRGPDIAPGEKEWSKLIRKSEARVGEGMVLRPKAAVEMS